MLLRQPGIETFTQELAQELYDPMGLVGGSSGEEHTVAFGSFLLETYGLERDASPTRLATMLVCDAVESGFDEEGIVERARAINIDDIVLPAMRRVIESTRSHAEDIIKHVKREAEPGPDKLTLAAADYMAWVSYGGKSRRSGSLYYEHPFRAAAMALHIFTKLEEKGYTIEREFKDAVICGDLLHDATEETVRSCKYYGPNRPEEFSPLLVRKVFEQSGNPHGQITANCLRLMTHYTDHPWAPKYPEYIALGSSDFMFCLEKPPDMWDNLNIDPKPAKSPEDAVKIVGKQGMYRDGLNTLSIAAPQRTKNHKNSAWARRYFTELQQIGPENMPKLQDDLRMYIYGSRTATWENVPGSRPRLVDSRHT